MLSQIIFNLDKIITSNINIIAMLASNLIPFSDCNSTRDCSFLFSQRLSFIGNVQLETEKGLENLGRLVG